MDWKYLLTSFDGRINRGKFWAGVGVLFAVGILANLIDLSLGTTGENGFGIVGGLASLASIYPALAIYAKRWHDREKSGWWTLILFVPVIGFFWVLIELGMLSGTRGPNQYGSDPLA